MAIDITCYTRLDELLLNEKISQMKLKYNQIFGKSYLIYDASNILSRQQLSLLNDEMKKYSQESKLLIAEEFGFKDPKSYFVIAVNDKSFPEMNTSEMAEFLRKELGKENIIVLLDGEILI